MTGLLHEWKENRRWMWGATAAVAVVLALMFHFTRSPAENAWMMPLAGKVIVVDPGHGGPDGGAVSEDGVVEKEVALRISHYLRDYLQEAGALVIMTREDDTDLASPETSRLRRRKTEDLMRRIELVKEKNADVLISIHLNSIPSPRWSGAQTFYNPVREENRRLAVLIQAELKRQLGNTDRLAKQKGDVYILKESPVPTALVEVGFLSHPGEAALLATESYQKRVAAAIYSGMIRYAAGEQPSPAE
jgi:N-acetylmuramoyl-L-alanine amidase